MEFKKMFSKTNLKISTLKIESKESKEWSKISSDDLESTRDNSNSPFFEIKDFSSLQSNDSPQELNFKPQIISGFHNRNFKKNLIISSATDNYFNSSLSINQPTNSVSQKVSIETMDFCFKSWSFPPFLAQTYEILAEIGRGKQGILYKLRNKSDNLLYVAKKIVCADEENKILILNEINILMHVKHERIVSFHDSFYDEETAIFWIIMKDFPSTTLLFFLKETHTSLSELLVKKIMFQILQAVNYLHELNICHRDLNLENVLISQNNLDIMLIDFGVSKQICSDKINMYSPVGSLNFRAPEFNEFGLYSLNYDIWQIGLIFIQLIRKETISTKKAIKLIEAGFVKNEEKISESANKLIEKMLEKNPLKRISCLEALKDEWFQGI